MQLLVSTGVALDIVRKHQRWPGAINPLPPSDAVRKQKKIVKRIFSVNYYHNLKNITPLET